MANEPGPSPQDRPAASPARRRAPVLISLAVALLAFAVTWWVVTANPSRPIQHTGAGQGVAPTSPKTRSERTPKTTTSARRQAEAIEELLSNSSSARAGLSDALAAAGRCDPKGLQAVRDITVSRRDQLALAKALDVSALKGGSRIKDALVDALDLSHDADIAFLAWAGRHAEKNCAGPAGSDRDYRRGLERSEAARKAKTRFAAAWRPVAQTYGLTAWKPGQI
ncbi:hypothetical protein HCN51_53815 [Nonomuraea sp. FMUSA5-5]|uniref:Secreted protein n=1 Tax=Nonomuraea composti TaxID=2720023 RepID=A0ABX1BP63_9ACTN|nr:hypothetical protein [Nonomuraea sp. FMUSA5-5]NJP98210.1 hypothetical protein [Nonomuraea sp. FMUSA5-5]